MSVLFGHSADRVPLGRIQGEPARLGHRICASTSPEDLERRRQVRAWLKRHQFDSRRGTPSAWPLVITADQADKARSRAGRRFPAYEPGHILRVVRLTCPEASEARATHVASAMWTLGFHDVPAARGVVFTGATRNSLVMPLRALALPDRLALAAAGPGAGVHDRFLSHVQQQPGLYGLPRAGITRRTRRLKASGAGPEGP